MNLFTFRKVCTTQSWAAWGFGLALLFFPDRLIQLMGLQPEQGLLLVSRLAGAMMFALGSVLHTVRNDISMTNRRTICGSNGSVDAAMAILFAKAAYNSVTNVWGYVFAGLFAVNAATWAIAYFYKKEG